MGKSELPICLWKTTIRAADFRRFSALGSQNYRYWEVKATGFDLDWEVRTTGFAVTAAAPTIIVSV